MAINFSAIHDDANCTAKPSEFISTPTFNTYVHNCDNSFHDKDRDGRV